MTTLHIALTGHRPTKLGGYNLSTPEYAALRADLEQYIRYQLTNHDTVVGHSGLALGADTIWSKAILNMRDQYPDRVKFHAEIPMMTQYKKWFKQSDIDFWHHQVAVADEKTIYATFDDPTNVTNQEAGKALKDRNIGMIDHSNVVLAVWDGTPGGTMHAVKYADKTNKPVVIIRPKTYFNK